MAPSESTPLLQPERASRLQVNNIISADSASYATLPRLQLPESQKTQSRVGVLFTLALSGFLSTLAFWQFFVDLPNIAVQLEGNMTPAQIFAANGLFLAISTSTALVASSLAPKCGTRCILLICLALAVLGSAAATTAQTLVWLHGGRLVQLVGTSAVWSLSIGTLAQVYDTEGSKGGVSAGRRVRALGAFVAVTPLGAAASLLVSEMACAYAEALALSVYDYWRLPQGGISVIALVCFVSGWWCLPRKAAPEEPMTRVADSRVSSVSSNNPFALLRLPHVVSLSMASGFPIYLANGLLWIQLEFHPHQNEDWWFLVAASLGLSTGALLSSLILSLINAALPSNGTPAQLSPSSTPATYLSPATPISSRAMLTPPPSAAAVAVKRRYRGLWVAVPGALLVSASLAAVSCVLKYEREIKEGAGARVWSGVFLACIFVAGAGTAGCVLPTLVYFVDVAPPERVAPLVAASDALQAVLFIPAAATFYALVVVITVVLLPPLWPLEFNLPGAACVLVCPMVIVAVIRRLKKGVLYPLLAADTTFDS